MTNGEHYTDLHRPIPTGCELEAILCLKTARTVRNDQTVAYSGQRSQIDDRLGARKVVVEERLDGSMRITHHGRTLDDHVIAARPVRAAETQTVHTPRRPVKPTPDHPWRKRLLPERRQHAAAGIT